MAAAYFGALLLACLAVIFAYRLRRREKHKQNIWRETPRPNKKHIDDEKIRESKASEMPKVEPHPGFDWQSTEPLKFRPFRPIYYITMALQSDTPSDLISIDQNYLDRITARSEIISAHPSTVHGSLPDAVAPLQELYLYILKSYLPARYPGLFKVSSSPTISGTPYVLPSQLFFHNLISQRSSPIFPIPTDPLKILRTLGTTVEEDLFLLKQLPDEEGGTHKLIAFVCCFPSGFDPSTKLGRILKDIHEPVPGFEKIGASMERFFSRLEVGNHIKKGQVVKHDEEIDISQARVRMEHQTVTRLPQTRAILFSFKSYLYPVKDIKDEGLGPEFADAIEGLRKGNAPGMWTYKGGIRWGRSVCEYLRS